MDSNINYSIIIPHYNIPQLLRRLLKTIPYWPDVQVIVVDDCSSEIHVKELKQILNDFPSVEYYSTEVKGGGGKARNVGLLHAKGKYLIFADADDFFTPCFSDVLIEYRDCDADIIYFSANSVDTDTYENADRAEYFHDKITKFIKSGNEDDIRFGFIVPWGRFIKRQIIEENSITFAETWVSNDMRFSTESDFHARKLLADQRAIYCVTDRAESTSKGQTSYEILSRLKTEAERFCFLKKHSPKHANEAVFMQHMKRIQETKDNGLIMKAEEIMVENLVSVKAVRKLVRRWYIRQLLHKVLSSIGLQRLH